MFKSQNPTIKSCNGKICNTTDNGQQGFCVPEVDTVNTCTQNLGEGCACEIGKRGCGEGRDRTVIDIYISNKTNQTLHLLKKGDKIALTNTSGQEITKDAAVGWVSSGINDYKPPQMINTNTTAFIRGWVDCIKSCCEEEAIFEIALQYSIGVPGKDLGTLIIPVCRVKPKGKCTKDCRERFGLIEVCFGSTINIDPPSGVYSITASRLSNTQAVVEISGGSGGTGGTGAACTVSPDTCSSGEICNPNTLRCEPISDGISNRQFIILIVVAGVAVVLVFGFLFFLIALRTKRET